MRLFRTFRLRYSLATFLVVLTFFALVVGLYAASARQQRLAVAKLESLGASVGYQSRLQDTIYPEWLTNRLGIDYFIPVHSVQLRKRRDSRKVVPLGADRLAQSVALIQRLPRVKSIRFTGTGIRDEDLALLAPLAPQIEELYFSESRNSELTGSCLQHFANWPRLKRLTLFNGQLDTKSLGHLAGIPSLASLTITGTLDKETFSSLAEVRNLTSLTLHSSTFNGRWLAALSNSPRLKSLELRNTTNSFRYRGPYTTEGDPIEPVQTEHIEFLFVPWSLHGVARDAPPANKKLDVHAHFERWRQQNVSNLRIGYSFFRS
ncbi:hypothetical protein [Aeoliella sp.]|uniref:hypothetical protein n=1 Tax=Aeoliella sp. TaxID=2795800 RepID=UPI003CCC4375